MRNSLWLALLVASVSCTSNTLSSTNLEYLRCSTAAMPAYPDTGATGSDTSLFGSQSTTNQNNCTSNPDVCGMLGANFSCDPARGCCSEANLGNCTKSSSCTLNNKPVCDLTNNICVACSAMDKTLGNMQCSAYATAQNDPLKQVLCIGGTCHECLDSSDCHRSGKGICNTKTFTCGGCTDDSQCSATSNICKVDDSLIVEPGDTVGNIGECANLANVVYVDNGNANCMTGDGTATKPFCQINSAINTGKPFIRVAGHGSATMTQIYSSVVVNGSQKVVILGTAGSREPSGTQVVINGLNVMGGGTLTLQEASVVSTMGAPAAVQCNGSSLSLKKVSVASYPGFQTNAGVVTNACKVNIEKTKIYFAQGYGLWITGGSGHRVVNNAIIRNGLNSGINQPFGLKLTGVTSGQFAFNTIAGNGQGVQCDSSLAISTSIVTSNGADPQLTASCQQTQVVTMGVTLDNSYTSGGDPKLTVDTNNLCIDKATADISVQDDYYGNPRGPVNNLYDIGFQEVK